MTSAHAFVGLKPEKSVNPRGEYFGRGAWFQYRMRAQHCGRYGRTDGNNPAPVKNSLRAKTLTHLAKINVTAQYDWAVACTAGFGFCTAESVVFTFREPDFPRRLLWNEAKLVNILCVPSSCAMVYNHVATSYSRFK